MVPVRVLVVDDHPVLREGICRALQGRGLDPVGEVSDGTEVVAACEALRPDVVLLDISLPGMDGISVTRALRARCPHARVVILTMYGDAATVQQAIRAGASGYLVKDCATGEIADVVNRVAAGQTVVSADLAYCLLGGAASQPESILTKREIEVLQLIAEGAATPEVADRLFISQKTVKNHLAAIYEKMNARDRTQAVLEGLRSGIIQMSGGLSVDQQRGSLSR